MSSTFLFILLCLASVSLMPYGTCYERDREDSPDNHQNHVNSAAHAVSEGLSRADQCRKPDLEKTGECMYTRGKSYAKYLQHQSCGALWCPGNDQKGQYICKTAAHVDEKTPCGDSKACHHRKCFMMAGGQARSHPIRQQLPQWPGNRRIPQ